MDANDRIACLLSSAAKRYPPVAFAVRRDGGEPGCQHASFALALVPGDDKPVGAPHQVRLESEAGSVADLDRRDRKSTRLNSSHVKTSYAVFCLKKKNKNKKISRPN